MFVNQMGVRRAVLSCSWKTTPERRPPPPSGGKRRACVRVYLLLRIQHERCGLITLQMAQKGSLV